MEKLVPAPLPEFLTTEQVSRRFKIDSATLSNWRSKGIGPNFIKLGAGPKARVRYKVSDLITWEKSLTRCVQAVRQNAEAELGRF